MYCIIYKLRFDTDLLKLASRHIFTDKPTANEYLFKMRLDCSRNHYIACKTQYDVDVWQAIDWEIRSKTFKLGEPDNTDFPNRRISYYNERWNYYEEYVPNFTVIGERNEELLSMYGDQVTLHLHEYDIYDILELTVIENKN